MFDVVKKAIDKKDPVGLLVIGASRNEYDRESREIASKISKNSDVDEIADIIANVFTCKFDGDFTKEIFIETAYEIRESLDLM